MNSVDTLLKKIKNKKAKIGIIGLGYVGLPLAVLIAEKGFPVTGYVRSEKKSTNLKNGQSNLADEELDKKLQKVLKNGNFTVSITKSDNLTPQDVLIICVPTPVSHDKTPDLTDLIGVSKHLESIDLTGKLIINESTVAPFTTRHVLGNFPGEYFLVSSPERIDPGNKSKTVANIPKVIGGLNPDSLLLAEALYKQILDEEVVLVNKLEGAEMAKILENTYRAVNIALINEFAKLAEQCDIDILEVIKAAKTKWSFQAHYPGIGVGGHCIPVDPYYLLELAKQKGLDMQVVAHSLKINEEMPAYIAEKVAKFYKKKMKVLVYGVTYKKDVNDIRESPVLEFAKVLTKKKIPFTVYDPYVSAKELKTLALPAGKIEKSDILVVATDHTQLEKDASKIIGEDTIVIDGRNFFHTKKGKAVHGIGRKFL